MSHSIKLTRSLTTKSGIPITFGTGSGTKWQWLKKGRPDDQQGTLHQDLVDQIALAINSGYNHIDTAAFYTTQPEVAAAIEKSGKKREDLFITSKFSGGFHGVVNAYKNATDNLEAILKELKTDYLDLYLIHAPMFYEIESHGETIESTWQHLINAKKAGKVRNIGVSNFAPKHLQRTFDVAKDPEYYPIVNQIEFHPYLQSQTPGIIEFAKEHNILLEAYGSLTPLFRIKKDGKELSKDEHPLPKLLEELSKKYGKTDAQILLRYTYQKGLLPVTTSSNEQRIKESLDVVNFSLDQTDIATIDSVGLTFKYRFLFGPEVDPVYA